MDGAIVLSSDLKKILYANVLLVPSIDISTKETGTRHKAAERTAKQFNTLTIAISERKGKVTIYCGELKYTLLETGELFRRASETLQILEKQKEALNDLLQNLNVLEVENLVTTNYVCDVLERMEIIKRMSTMVKRYLVELGKEGLVVSMRHKELTSNISKERDLILRDYFPSRHTKISSMLENMNFDFLIETSNLTRILFGELRDRPISPRGIRILGKTGLLDKNIRALISRFGTFDKILNADDEGLLEVLKKKTLVDSFKEELTLIKERILSEKKFE